MENLQIIFNLIKSAFEKRVFHFISNDENELFTIINENGLVGLLYKSIDSQSFKDKEIFNKLKRQFNLFISKDLKQQLVIENIKDILELNQIKYIFLKGTNLKNMYPESYQRGMGDIDLLVAEEDYFKVKELFLNNNIRYLSATSHHLVFQTIDRIEIEVHKSLASIVEYEQTDFLNNPWKYSTKKDKNEYILVPEYEICYLLSHLTRHIRTSGVGLRSLLDIYVFNEHNKEYDQELLELLLEKSKLTLFFNKINHLNKILTLECEPNEEDLKVLNYFIKSGIHGKGYNHDKYTPKIAHEKTKYNKSKFKYFLGEVFPSKKRIEESYPYLKKHGYLLPIAWVSRIFKQVFFKRKDTKKRLKALSKNDDISKIDEIYNYLGV